jgi:hypothetical protein
MRRARSFVLLAAAGVLSCGGDTRDPGNGSGSGSEPDNTPKVTELAIGLTASLPVGLSGELRALHRYSDGSETDVSLEATWASSNTAAATIEAVAGQVAKLVAVGEGTATITVTVGERNASADVTIAPAAVASILIAPSDPVLRPDESVRLTAVGRMTDGKSKDLSGMVTWTSQRPAVATVDETGVVVGVGLGQSFIRATAGEISGMVTAKVECAYPEETSRVRYGQTIPALSWSGAYLADNSQIDFSLYNFHCSRGYDQYKSIAFIVGAGWCPNCPDYTRRVARQQAELDAAGMLLVFIEAEDNSRRVADNEDARTILDRLIRGVPGIRAGDGISEPVASPFRSAVSGYPSAFVVRRSDMKVIADQGRSNYVLDFRAIASDPDRMH